MSGRRSFQSLHQFDQAFRFRYGTVAGVDEAGRGPLAGPVVAAAVILPVDFRDSLLNDSKILSKIQRDKVYAHIQQEATAIAVASVDAVEIDQINILRATRTAMRLAISRLIVEPVHILIDGHPLPDLPWQHSGVVDGDAKSASIAAASIVAKVTRDAWMEQWDRRYPGYGFREHKGYGTPMHMQNLRRLGPSPIHRTSFRPVRELVQMVIND